MEEDPSKLEVTYWCELAFRIYNDVERVGDSSNKTRNLYMYLTSNLCHILDFI